jgi:hypothetical protein
MSLSTENPSARVEALGDQELFFCDFSLAPQYLAHRQSVNTCGRKVGKREGGGNG